MVLSLSFTACADSGVKSQELYDTAQLEEQQRNFPHAKKLYQKIIEDYPRTPSAEKAKERLKALEDEPPR